jgi:hypothetical protein
MSDVPNAPVVRIPRAFGDERKRAKCLSATHRRGTFRHGWRRPARRFGVRSGGSLFSCGASPSPVCFSRSLAAATIHGGTRRFRAETIPTSPSVTVRTCGASPASRWRPRHWRRSLATSGQARCHHHQRCRIWRNRAYSPASNNQCQAHPSFSRIRPPRVSQLQPGPHHLRRAAVRPRPVPTSLASHPCRVRVLLLRRIRNHPIPAPAAKSFRRRKDRASPVAARADIRPSLRRAVEPPLWCPMAMAPAQSYIRTAGSRRCPQPAEAA